MNKQPQVTDATRSYLLTAFWELLENRPISQIGIRDITDRAGYHRGTFYRYFVDIFDLLKEEELSLIERITILGGESAMGKGVDGMIREIGEFYLENGGKLSMLMGPNGDPEFLPLFKDALYPAFRSMRTLPDSESAHVVFDFGISGLLMAFNGWYSRGRLMPVDEFIKIARTVIEAGIPKALISIR
jgi:Transcriptional regulator